MSAVSQLTIPSPSSNSLRKCLSSSSAVFSHCSTASWAVASPKMISTTRTISFKHSGRAVDAVTYHLTGRSNSFTFGKALEADFSIAHIEFKVTADQTVICAANELGHGSHHFLVILFGTKRRTGVDNMLVLLYTNEIVDFLILHLSERQNLNSPRFSLNEKCYSSSVR